MQVVRQRDLILAQLQGYDDFSPHKADFLAQEVCASRVGAPALSLVGSSLNYAALYNNDRFNNYRFPGLQSWCRVERRCCSATRIFHGINLSGHVGEDPQSGTMVPVPLYVRSGEHKGFMSPITRREMPLTLLTRTNAAISL
ncbi:hypothetical protein AJ80_00559 [Polytolypa hystricis UAMH7299]|uniref:Uncharacterized protein n=1 Tax=Polytolypa hystricis (strain UAMH7299) TaxID=1447883 RepID=A0A2B7Z338_POLH7|nr:hypothetical protein AJ80_00559 [Polytolypa hystricis UAMH7299]